MLVLTALSSGAASTWAGEPDSTKFRIQDYIPERFTDFQWRLDGSVRTGDDTHDTDTIYSDNLKHNQTTGPNEIESGGFGIVNNWRYRYETRQGLFDCTFGITTSFNHRDSETANSLVDTLGLPRNEDSSQSESDYSFDFPVQAEFRRYVIGDAFLEVEGSFWYFYDQNNDHNIDIRHSVTGDDTPGWLKISDSRRDDKFRYINRRVDFAGEIRLGWGRVYRGKYASTAISIVDQLKRSGLITRTPNRSEMLELTRLVHGYREGHGPDEREYRASTLQGIVMLLHNQGVTADESAAVLLLVEDVLDYFPTGDRSFGWNAQVGFGGHDVYYNNQGDYDLRYSWTVSRSNPDSTLIIDTLQFSSSHSVHSYETRNFRPADHIALNLSYYRPLSARWQFDCSVVTWFYLNRNTPSQAVPYQSGLDYQRSFDKRVIVSRASLQYYHDARTTLILGCDWLDSVRTDRYRVLYLTPLGNASDETTDWRVRNWTLQLTVGADYRLSPATSLGLELTYWRLCDRTERPQYVTENKRRYIAVSAGITHWLF